ncbi:hypothetical protein CDD83_4472 [Cordyceps sp. RAO-2017]|nr:hypothetical protein CDD83_4472 [Cordyceps sp. RAO-2017]
MKSGATKLYDSPTTAERVAAYAHAHSSPLPQHLLDYHARIAAARADSLMLSSNFQSQLHLLLARAVGARRERGR